MLPGSHYRLVLVRLRIAGLWISVHQSSVFAPSSQKREENANESKAETEVEAGADTEVETRAEAETGVKVGTGVEIGAEVETGAETEARRTHILTRDVESKSFDHPTFLIGCKK